jgi:hypothetical protein
MQIKGDSRRLKWLKSTKPLAKDAKGHGDVAPEK